MNSLWKGLRRSIPAMVAALATALPAAERPLSVTADMSQAGAPVSPYLYGFFTELLSNWFEMGLWAEMLGDRKFYYPVNSAEQQPPPNSRRFVGRWRPVGPDEFVTMDRGRAYVGEHSPRIRLETGVAHGIRQGGLGLKKGKHYVGRVILAAEPGAQVTVSLIWGPNPSDRQSVQVSGLRRHYKKFPLRFTAGADTNDGQLEIVGTGTSSFHIGAVSLMPADNIQGYRADMIAALREIGPTMFRWPGGNFVSGYDWRDGIGDPDQRPPRYDYAWRALEPNDVGTDEFLALCKLLGVEPYICVNAGFGDAHSAAQWVEYVNGAPTTPMGRWRAANGHPQPYKVKWWNIGNEMYGPWQLGHMSLNHYAIKHNLFAQAMRRVDPDIKIVASGATPAEMSTTGSARSITGNPVAEFGGPADWTGGLLANSAPYLDAIAEHLYPRADRAFDPEKKEFTPVEDSLADRARRLPNRVRCAAEAWEEYQRRFPALNLEKIPIFLDEWIPGRIGGGRDSVFGALSSAMALHELFRHSRLFLMSGYTHAAGLLSYNKTDVAIRPVGLMFQLYRRRFGTIPVALSGNSPQPDVKGVVWVDKPRVPSGSPTYPLDAAAALTADRKSLTLAVVNPTEEPHLMEFKLAGATSQGKVRLWRIAANELTDANEPGQPPKVGIRESTLDQFPNSLEIPKLSISVYEFPLQ